MLIAVSNYSWLYIKIQDKEIATLKANAVVLEQKIDEQNASIDNYLAKQKETNEQISKLNDQNLAAMREVSELRNTFQKHSLTNLAMAKPGLIENIINKGTAKVKTDFLELTDPKMFEEKNEETVNN